MFKKIIIIASILFLQFSNGIGVVFANDDLSKPKQVLVSEKVPGANCKCAVKAPQNDKDAVNGYKPWTAVECAKEIPIYERAYICEHGRGLDGFSQTFAAIIRWVVQISLLLGTLAVAALGVAWAVAGGDNPAYKEGLKKWLINLIIGLTILFMFRYILGFLAPWIYQ